MKKFNKKLEQDLVTEAKSLISEISVMISNWSQQRDEKKINKLKQIKEKLEEFIKNN